MSKSEVTWNYQESGHGNGTPDGFGAIVKWTTANFVKYGGNFDSFEGFWALIIKNIPNVHFQLITDS